jgi:hypothetical protein
MPLIYITGLSGAGKSAVLKELLQRGFEAHGVDEEGFGDWVDRKTGVIRQLPDGQNWHAWYQDYEWVLSPDRVARLKQQADRDGKAVFLCGIGSGESAVWHLFETVVGLVADAGTLRQRIASRDDNEFGKSPAELAEVLRWHETYEESCRTVGACIIDAARPLQVVVDDILTLSGAG